jgi:recombination protein RecA
MTKSNLKVVKSTKDQEMDIKEKNKALDAGYSSDNRQFWKRFSNEAWPKKSNGY